MGSFSLSGGVEVIGFISPTDSLDTYAVIDPLYGVDGFRNVNFISDLDLIPEPRRRAGMVVGVSGGTAYYKLNSLPWNYNFTDWSVFNTGGSMSGDYLPLSGGTVTGNTVFNLGLSANTISATTYQNLPIDIRVTGGTYSNGSVTFTNNTGGTFNVTGFYTGTTDNDRYVTGFTYSSNTFTILDNSGNTFDATFTDVTGLTVNGDLNITGTTYSNTLSATTYLNLPTNIDVFVTGGTYSNGSANFTNNTGGTFSVSGFVSGDTFVTGFTYSNNTFTIGRNQGQPNLIATINTVTGLTINGGLTVTGTSNLNGIITSSNLSGSTDRLVQVNSGGTFSATQEIISAYITSGGTAANKLENVSNWDINGNYTGSSITGTYQGQKHYDGNYFYEAVQDNIFIRLIRG